MLGLLIGGSNLLPWLASSNPLPALMVMRVNTAFGITAASLALALWYHAEKCSGRARIAQGLGTVAALIGGLTAAQDLCGINLHIDQLIGPATFPGDFADAFTTHPGRMSLNAALSLFFLGLSLAGLDRCATVKSKRFCVAPGLAILAALPAALGLVGYLLGIGAFTGMLQSANVLLHTAVALFILSIGVLASRPERPPVRRILSTGADGLLLRWTLPGTLGLLLTLGWIIGRSLEARLVTAGEGTALMLYGGLVLLSALLVAASNAVNRQEKRARDAVEALLAGQQASRAIIDTALDAVLLVDAGGLIAGWNPAAERIFGWRSDEVLGQPLANLIIPPRLRDAHNRALGRLLKTGEGPIFGQRLELAALRRDGSEFPAELSINLLRRTDRPLFVGFIRDITEAKAAEKNLHAAKEAAESASRAKDNFLATLSHELRTPLAPVLLSASALRHDERLPAETREQMAMIERNVVLEARLIDDMLDLTRITRGKLELRAEHCDAHSLIGYALEIVRQEAAPKNIALKLDLAARHSGLTGDPTRLQQVFWNLFKNAVKFTPAGGNISITTCNEPSGNRLIVEVIDNGIGFTADVAERMFEPFEQAGREGDHRFGGLGLGLAIARAIVDLHGGILRARSSGAGLGATFTVELPGAIEPPAGVIAAPGPLTKNGRDPAPLRILVVEDHEPTLSVLTRMLGRAGHHVVGADSIAAALHTADPSKLDVVISDVGLPDGTGLELIGKLRAGAPKLRGIALSGYGMEEDLARSRRAGFTAHLVKPIDFEQLQQALRELSEAD